MPEQLPLDFTASVSVRMRRAKKVKEQDALQPQLFVAPPNLDVHLHSPSEAVAQIGGSDPDRTIVWLQALVGTVRVIKSKRVAFPTERLDRLLHVRPPAQVTLDAASMAVARSIWAKKLGLKPLKVMRDRQRLYAASQRWPRGFGVTDAPWPAIATLNHLGLPLDIDARAKALMTTKLAGTGSHIATAGLAGSAVMFEARQPTLLENLQLPALAYMGEEGTGMYKMPLLSAECLLTEPSIKLSPDLEQAIKKACAPVKPLKTDETFPWTLYGFQAKDAARGMQILETTGGVLFAGEMGSGKTTVSLALVHEMDIWPLLVVAPLSAFSTWERQIGEMNRKVYLATEAPAKSWAAIESGDYEAVVISFDRLGAFTEIVERYGFKGIIADEIQRIRTPGSKRSRALRSLAASVPFRMGLSGTPLTNTVQDLLPVGSFLVPGEWKPRANAKDLEDLYPGDPIESVAEHLGTLMVRRRMVDTGAKLPKRNDHRIFVQLTPEQRRALADLEAEAEAAKEAGEFDDVSQKMHAFVRLHRARQIINSPNAAGLGGMNPKVRAAIDVAEDFTSQGRKGVIFCADRQTFRDIGKGLDEVGIGWVGIWGATSSKDRIKNEKRFHEDPSVKVVVCTIQAGAESWSASPTGTWLLSTSYMYQAAILEQMECSVPGALVTTDAGTLPVEEVKVGQLVRTHTGALQPVTGVSERFATTSVYAVTLEGESAPRLELTGEHPVHAFSRGFVEEHAAQDRSAELSPAWFPTRVLEAGDYVVVDEALATGTVNSFPVREVASVEERPYEGPVHNFSVAEDESYVLNGSIVHNCRVFRLSSDPDGPDIEIMYLHAQVPGGSLDDRMVEILAVKKALFAQVVDRTVHVDNTKTHYSMSDLVYLLTGKKDERLEKIEADRKAAADREQAMKDHAKKTLYAKKGKNKTSVEAFYDSGDMAKTLEEYLEAEEVEVPKEVLSAAGLADDSDGMDEDFDVEEGDDDFVE